MTDTPDRPSWNVLWDRRADLARDVAELLERLPDVDLPTIHGPMFMALGRDVRSVLQTIDTYDWHARIQELADGDG